MINSKKGSRKTIRTTLAAGMRGQMVIQKTNRVSRKIRVANLLSRRKNNSLLSSLPSISTALTSSSTQEPIRYMKHGVLFDEFIEGNGLDWRKFGCNTFDGMQTSGYYDFLMKRIIDYFRARTNKTKHNLVLSSSELPLSDNASTNLHTKVIVVNSLLLKVADNPSGSIVDMSNSIENHVLVESAEQIRRWTLQFIHNGGTFKNHSYKKRPSIGIISDPSIRETMTKWMLNATRAKPPATANDFKDFVNAEYQTNIHERTAQIWLHLLGFKYRSSEALEIYNDGHQRPDVKLATSQYCMEMLNIQEHCILYTGENMNREVPPVTNGREKVVSYLKDGQDIDITLKMAKISNSRCSLLLEISFIIKLKEARNVIIMSIKSHSGQQRIMESVKLLQKDQKLLG